MPEEQKYRKYSWELNTQQFVNNQQIAAIAITVTTSNIPYAGTDADVRLMIGAKRFDMDTPGYNDFEKGDNDTYYFKTDDLTLEKLRKSYITLSHDDSGKHSGWHVANIVLQIQKPNDPYFYLYKRWGNVGWLAKDEGPYYTTEVELQHAI